MMLFFLLRNGYISFYYKGGGLLKYDGKFSTHYKYAFVPEDTSKNYVNEESVAKMKTVPTFLDGYNQIKERCKKYGTIEADGVSVLYQMNATNV